MKNKPSLDLEQFRNGGVDVNRSPAILSSPVPQKNTGERINKTIRIQKAFDAKLKEIAYHRTAAEGKRVTESDIIEEVLELYFKGIKA